MKNPTSTPVIVATIATPNRPSTHPATQPTGPVANEPSPWPSTVVEVQ